MRRLKAEQEKKKEDEAKGVTEQKVLDSGEIMWKKELPTIDLKEIPQCKMTIDDKDIMNFKVTITPDKESWWYGESYVFTISITSKYNFEPPKVHCLTKIYHPNIDLQGNVCLNILRKEWNPVLNITTVIVGLNHLFLEPEPNDPLNHNAAQLMRENLDQFIRNVKNSVKGTAVGGEYFGKFAK
jgi:ubiquitin-conjugating enzyme E2 M